MRVFYLYIAIIIGSYASCKKTEGFVTHNCGIDSTFQFVEDSTIESKVFIANAFTPNGDGRNDCWRISGTNLTNTNFFLEIKSGNKTVFTSRNLYTFWNGTNVSGVCAGAGKYSYQFFVTGKNGQRLEFKGETTLLLMDSGGKCLGINPSNLYKLHFQDMIDPSQGFIYQTQEPVCI
ncbi:MAG: gliding motility-associated C-terminal domain-containing protein [Bacteroidetes bacterium]|nr:gliding motility-associated C-terminal domain-containing protein [Bacteroidota bacterium]